MKRSNTPGLPNRGPGASRTPLRAPARASLVEWCPPRSTQALTPPATRGRVLVARPARAGREGPLGEVRGDLLGERAVLRGVRDGPLGEDLVVALEREQRDDLLPSSGAEVTDSAAIPQAAPTSSGLALIQPTRSPPQTDLPSEPTVMIASRWCACSAAAAKGRTSRGGPRVSSAVVSSARM